MTVPNSPIQNQLLAALPADEFKRLSYHLELAPMRLGEGYCELKGKLQHVYFPISAIVSLHYAMENGASAEIAAVGKEGMLGIPLFIGGNAGSCRASVRVAGFAYKMKAQALMDEFNRAGCMRRLLLRYTHALIVQTYQTVSCNRQHSLMQRLCRWLLQSMDRMPSNDLPLTEELLAAMLGVRRDVLAAALAKLQQSKIVSCCRGRINVLNRGGLERYVCACYGTVKKEFDNLLGLDWDWRPMPESVQTWSRAKMTFDARCA